MYQLINPNQLINCYASVLRLFNKKP